METRRTVYVVQFTYPEAPTPRAWMDDGEHDSPIRACATAVERQQGDDLRLYRVISRNITITETVISGPES